jgi:hypothetical protein
MYIGGHIVPFPFQPFPEQNQTIKTNELQQEITPTNTAPDCAH